MDPRVKASLLWGAVGLLSFLVLLQAYRLATGRGTTLPVAAGAALFVGVGTTVLVYLADARLNRNESP